MSLPESAALPRLFPLSLALVLALSVAPAAQAASKPSIAEATAGMRKIDGFIPAYWDAARGKMWLEVDRWNQDFLYLCSLPAGLGSNDIGLDRGLLSRARVVAFERAGSRILLIEKNYSFRASSANAMEVRAVADSFASSALWGFDVAAAEGDRALVDATGFFQHDMAGAAKAIAKAKQGTYKVDPERCAFYLERTKGFPKNTDVEVTLTLTGNDPGKYVQEVTPYPEAITLREHHSFVALPEDGYRPRAFDPRAGYFDMTYRDYSAPLGEDVDRRLILRHNLLKPIGEATGEPVTPIVYYVDGGAPADVRQALMDGAAWWAQAFEAAGFRNAFQVKVLPPEVDPMDIRYNVVQWVHRYTRGWSYGDAIADPRTGEILKGQVSLGSLRYRQDYLIFSSLLSPFGDSTQPPAALTAPVYARLRQLAAHEIGHTLGLAHNYIASTHANASVMDYPHPMIELRGDGSIDLSHAYATGIGEWDKIAIRYGYTEFPAGTDERKALDAILLDAARKGNTFISDADSRPLGSAHPQAHLWDNGPDPLDELTRLLKVRAAALARFGENSIPVGAPLATLDETLVPLYYLHRYQTEAVAKVLGGLTYTYALRGDGQTITSIVPPDRQRRALKLLIQTISPQTLTLPERIIALIPPHPPGYDRTRESFPSQTGVTFDPIAAAQAAAQLTGSLLFNPERDARLIEFHARNQADPGLPEVIDSVARAAWLAPAAPGLAGQVKNAVDLVLFEQLLTLGRDGAASPLVRSIAAVSLKAERTRLPAYLSQLLADYERDPDRFRPAPLVTPPPGQPIGEDDCVRPILP